MDNDFANRSANGFVIICTLEGEIKEIIYNSLEIRNLESGKLFSSIVEKSSFKKAVEFIRGLNKNSALFSWEINILIKDEVIPFKFSGINENDELLIIAGSGFGSILDHYEKITKMNNEHVNRFRKLIKNKLNDFEIKEKFVEKEESYKELMKLNNELSNLQRKLMKKNKRLENEREKFRVTLESIAEGVITIDKEGKITFLNPIAEELLNKKEIDVLGKKCFKELNLLDPITSKSLEEGLRDEIKTGKIVEEDEIILKISENKSLPIAFKSSPIKDSNGNIFGSVIVFRDIIKQKEKQEKLKEYASTDKLTGTFNRRMGLIFLNKEIEYAKKNNSNLSVCFVDVNNLKEINDNLGHATGDELLIKLTQVLKNNVRESDAVVRFGGDEFLLIFPNIKKEAAEKIWKRIKSELNRINNIKDNQFNISVSHGIVECEDGCSSSAEKLISIADEKMYKEKQMIKKGEITDA